MSTFPFLQNPSGQTTTALLENAPSSSKDIGDLVAGSK